MNILMCSAQTFIPQAAGGAQSSTHECILELRRLGHPVCLLSALSGDGWTAFRGRLTMKVTGQRAARDRALGYDAYRAWFPEQAVAETVRRVCPDVAVLPTWHAVPMAHALQALGIPVVIYLRDVEFDDLGGDLAALRGVHYIANSQFTAASYRSHFGIVATVVPPLFRAERYRTATARRFVTFINPQRVKGLEIALELAQACPDIAFRFVEGWTIAPGERADLLARASACGNIVWTPRTQNMRAVYAQAKILLAPSQWEEAWGRVVTEAQFSGIPALASTRGGLPESVGPGGILLDADAPLEHWVAALRRLHDDAACYAAMSSAALAWADRPGLDPRAQAADVMGVLEASVAAHAKALADA